jgi:hypothetical protein
MSARNLPSTRSSSVSANVNKPLSRLQAYLVEVEVCLGLLRKVLLELKEVAFVIVMILFFIWSALQLFKGIH